MLSRILRAESLAPRLLALAALAPVSTVFASAFQGPDVTWRTQALLAAVGIFSAIRPAGGLLAAAALAPLHWYLVSVLTFNPLLRLAEAIVLAFLTGWLIRRVCSNETRPLQLGRLGPPMWLFGTVVVASLAVDLLATPLPGESWPDAGNTLRMFATSYLNGRGFEPNQPRAAGMLLEGLLIVAAVVSLSATRPKLPRQLLHVATVTAAACAILSLYQLNRMILRAEQVDGSVLRTLMTARVSYFADDLNAAGSYFALFLFVALGAAIEGARRRSWWVAAVPLLGIGLWLTGSRAAVGAAVVAGLWYAARMLRRRGWSLWTTAGLLGGAVLLAGAAEWLLLPKHIYDADGTPLDPLGLMSLKSRWLFQAASWAMWQTAPLLGIGVGRYYGESHAFMPPRLAAAFPFGENAHNYFAQLGVELGLVGLLVFVWLLAAAAREILKEPFASRPMIVTGAAAGLAAFLLSALVSHPLLVRQVAFPFWFVMAAAVLLARRTESASGPGDGGIVSGESGWRRARWPGRAAAVVGIAVLAVSVPVRVQHAASQPGRTYGFSGSEVDPVSGVRFRWTTGRARLMVAPQDSGLVLWLRAPDPGRSRSPVTVEVRVNGSVTTRLQPPSDRWHRLVVMLPRAASNEEIWQIDLSVSPAWRDAGGEERGVMISRSDPSA